jgi:hypothetical protein
MVLPKTQINFNSDIAGTGQRRTFGIVDFGFDGGKGNFTLIEFLPTADLSAVDPATKNDLYPLGAGGHGLFHRGKNHPAVGHTFG